MRIQFWERESSSGNVDLGTSNYLCIIFTPYIETSLTVLNTVNFIRQLMCCIKSSIWRIGRYTIRVVSLSTPWIRGESSTEICKKTKIRANVVHESGSAKFLLFSFSHRTVIPRPVLLTQRKVTARWTPAQVTNRVKRTSRRLNQIRTHRNPFSSSYYRENCIFIIATTMFPTSFLYLTSF